MDAEMTQKKQMEVAQMRFGVIAPLVQFEEPYAGKLHVRFCEGQ